MWTDPIVEEIHKFRQEYAASFNYDMNAIYEDLKKRELESIKAERKVVSLKEMRKRYAKKKTLMD